MKRLCALATDAARANLGRAVPFKLTLIVTELCSCRCSPCQLWRDPRPGPGLDEVRRFFAANPHLSWINLSGGEVVDHPRFVDVVEAAVLATRVYALDFPTAGQRPEEAERRVREVLRLRLPRLFVTVSLDGPPAVHDRLRGLPGAFERACDTFRRLRALDARRLAVRAGLTFSSCNDADPDGLVRDLLAAAPFLRREDLHFNIAHHARHAYRNRRQVAPHSGRIGAFLARHASGQRAGANPLALLEQAYARLSSAYLATHRCPVPCAALAASAYVDPELRLFPCASWDRPLLDLRDVDYSLARAARSEVARAARRDAAAGRCPGCWTPCEAFPSMVSRVLPAAAALRRSRRAARAARSLCAEECQCGPA
ncbi:MAG: radical SAM protein [Planctomycetes bacterium]|nr:radical SAM protein [Planctomycetota bacterium]